MTRHRELDAALDRLLDTLADDIVAAPEDDVRPALAGPDGKRALRAARDAVGEAVAHGNVAGLGLPPDTRAMSGRDPRARPH